MSQTMLLTLLMATPLVISLLAFACRLAGGGAKGVVTLVHTTGISLMLVFSLWMVYTISAEGDLLMANRWIHLDSLAGYSGDPRDCRFPDRSVLHRLHEPRSK